MTTYARMRNRGAVVGGVVTKYSNAPSGNYPTYTTFMVVPNVKGSTESIWDSPTPDFRNKVRRGDVILNELSQSSTTINTNTSTFTLGPYNDWGVSTLTGHLAAMGGAVGSRDPFDSKGQVALGDAVNKAFAKAYGSAVMGGEILGDFAKTLGMLHHPLSSSIDLTKRMISRRDWWKKKKSISTLAQASSKAWLELRYGWQPLVLDSYSIMLEAQDIRAGLQRKRLIVRAGTPFNLSNTQDYGRTGYGSWPNLSSYGSIVTSGRGVASAGVIIEVSEPQSHAEAAARALGFGAKDLPSVVWELIPFSFVVDWFAGVGSWIQASCPDPNVTVRGSWGTRVAEWSSKCSVELYHPGPLTHHPPTIKGVGTYEQIHKYHIRNVGVIPTSTPPVTAEKPSLAHLVDALSLLTTNVSSGLRKLRH